MDPGFIYFCELLQTRCIGVSSGDQFNSGKTTTTTVMVKDLIGNLNVGSAGHHRQQRSARTCWSSAMDGVYDFVED